MALVAAFALGQPFDQKLYSAMRWRLIGPFRGGRVTAVAGVSGNPNVYYFGTPGGGIWKSSNAGRVWKPIFDSSHVASIGALAVAPSDGNILYAGTGEQTMGDGLYRSDDAGASWRHAGLSDTRFIQAVVVDPKNPDIVVVGANSLGFEILWEPYPKAALKIERGIYKTTNGGKSWAKVAAHEDTAGVVDLCADPENPATLYAVFFRPPAGSGKTKVQATSELYRSRDEGSTWQPVGAKGLPEKGRGRMGIAVAPGNEGRRLYAIVDQGLFRSDDGGASWSKSTQDPRILGSNYFSRVFADPRNADLLYVAQTSLYRSTDGGHSFEAYVGAPSGDDFHVLWIDRQNPSRLLLGVDQGAIVSVDAGHSWSSWYNQPTGQFYHVSTDKAFPYRVYAAQQDSGTAAVLSRSDYGEITARDWYSIAGFEYCYIAADPLNANVVYSGGWYGSVIRFDKRTGQFATVFERGQEYRTAQMAPLVYSPQDPRTLYLGTQFVLKTSNGGSSWTAVSPDLTGYVEKTPEKEDGAADTGSAASPPPAITTLAPSAVRAGVIWAGTSNRKVQVTRDGGRTWQDVSPAGLAEPNQILTVEAGRHDAGTAYVTAGGRREFTPAYIVRTRDYGKSWTPITHGLPVEERVRVVREDPVRKGLLYAGTEAGVYVSFDDGDEWQPLQLNLPVATVTDLEVHDNDLVASTFGRALWVLDDLTPLRDAAGSQLTDGAYFYRPEPTVRVRWDNNQDTPYPPETPAGENPPDGAIFNYFLKGAASGPAALTIRNSEGSVVRQYSSEPKRVTLPLANAPSYWFAPPERVTTEAGLNRFVWDLRYAPPRALPYSYFGGLLEYTEYTLADHAIPGATPAEQPQGPLVIPGTYTAELQVGGKTYRQQLTVTLDPRVEAAPGALERQLQLARQISEGMNVSFAAYHAADDLKRALAERKRQLDGTRAGPLKDQADRLEKKVSGLLSGPKKWPGFGPVNRDLTRLITGVESADAAPNETAIAAVRENCKALAGDLEKWRVINSDLARLNSALVGSRLAPLAPAQVPAKGCEE